VDNGMLEKKRKPGREARRLARKAEIERMAAKRRRELKKLRLPKPKVAKAKRTVRLIRRRKIRTTICSDTPAEYII
jgi:hypothetical protein